MKIENIDENAGYQSHEDCCVRHYHPSLILEDMKNSKAKKVTIEMRDVDNKLLTRTIISRDMRKKDNKL